MIRGRSRPNITHIYTVPVHPSVIDTDSGLGEDLGLLYATISSSDMGSALDGLALATVGGESITAIETAFITVFTSDSASDNENSYLVLDQSETCHATESESLILSVTEIGIVIETTLISFSSSDSTSGQETGYLGLNQSETGSGAEEPESLQGSFGDSENPAGYEYFILFTTNPEPIIKTVATITVLEPV